MIAPSTLAALRPEMSALILDHWEEVGQDRTRMRLDPDWEAGLALEQAGQLAVFAARIDGRLVGYSVFVVRRHFHYRTVRIAVNDLIYIAPAHRGRLAMRLIRGAEPELVARGVAKIFYGVKAWLDFGPLLKRLGYAPMETVWAKWVGD